MKFVELVGETFKDGKEVVCDIVETRVDEQVAYNVTCFDKDHRPVYVVTNYICSWDSVYELAFNGLSAMAGADRTTIRTELYTNITVVAF